MSTMRIVALIALLALAGGSAANAWDWPTDDPELVATFGQYVMSRYQPGIVFAAVAGEEWQPAPAKLLYSRREVEPLSRVPSTVGDFSLSSHNDGFLFVLGSLPSGSYLAIADTQQGLWVNPVGLLPDLADGAAPRAEPPTLRGSAGTFSVAESRAVPPGTYELIVSASDVVRSGGRSLLVAPYALAVTVGAQADDVAGPQPPVAEATVEFDVILFDDARPMVGFSRPHPADELYELEGLYNLGSLELGPGRYPVELTVEDGMGNRFGRSYTLTVSTPGES